MNGRSAQTPSHRSQFRLAGGSSIRVGRGAGIAPLLAAPGVDFLHLADRPVLHQLDRRAVLAAGVDLDAHLRDELLLAGHFGQPARLVDVVRQRLLAVDVQAALHAAMAIGACMWSGVETLTESRFFSSLSSSSRQSDRP